MAPNSPLLSGFTIKSLLTVLLCQLASAEEGGSLEYRCAWLQLRNLRKNLGRLGWGDYWRFLISSSCCSHRPTVLLWEHVSSQISYALRLLGIKYLHASVLALIDRLLGLSTSDNNNNNNNNNDDDDDNNNNNNNNNSYWKVSRKLDSLNISKRNATFPQI